MIAFDTQIRVWYVDTDQMGIVHHSNYIKYYEEARSAFMRHLGVSYADMESSGVVMPILKVESNYLRPARYDDLLTVRITIKDIPMARFVADYEIYNADNVLLNTGSTTLGFLNKSTMRPCRAPEWFVKLLQREMEQTASGDE